jgi:carboxyl-terminal processing protease
LKLNYEQMKKSYALLLMLLYSASYGQVNLKAIVDTVILKTKEQSLYSSSVNWDTLENQIVLKAEKAKTVEELKPAFEYMLNKLRDHHGRVLSAKNYSNLAYFTDYKNHRSPDKRTKEMEVWKVVNDVNLKFEYAVLDGDIGYLKIVGIGPNVDMEQEARKIRNAVNEICKKGIEKWVFDLRYNAGGNMHPMMAGIGPLVGEGLVGSLVNMKNEKLFDWIIKDGNFIYNDYQAFNIPNKATIKKSTKFAILTSRWTASSGEIVATALKGRPNTRFFGEASAGSTTNTNGENIAGEVILSISTGFYCDRNGTAYTENIPVDEEVPFVVFKDKTKDDCIILAKNWLNKK